MEILSCITMDPTGLSIMMKMDFMVHFHKLKIQ